MEIIDLFVELRRKGVLTTIDYNSQNNSVYLDLETGAKSHIYLYPDGKILGRYNYESKVDMNQPVNDLIKDLCVEFLTSLHGRGYYQAAWRDLCLNYNLQFPQLDY